MTPARWWLLACAAVPVGLAVYGWVDYMVRRQRWLRGTT